RRRRRRRSGHRGRGGRIDARLLHGPLMAFAAVARLLLRVLPLARIRERLSRAGTKLPIRSVSATPIAPAFPRASRMVPPPFDDVHRRRRCTIARRRVSGPWDLRPSPQGPIVASSSESYRRDAVVARWEGPMMIRVVPMVAVAASLLFTLPSAAAEHTRATGAVDAVTVRGTVEEIDRTRGTVALVGRDRGVLVLEVAIPQSLEAVS